MKNLHLILTALLAFPTLGLACGDYGSLEALQLTTRHVAAHSHRGNLTAETFTYYVDDQGKEVRHGQAFQFDTAGNLIGQCTYRHGSVWSGSHARIGMGCGVYAARTYYKNGKSAGREQLKGKLIDLGNRRFGFEVEPAHLEFVGKAPQAPKAG